MKTVPLRQLAELSPSTPEFDALSIDTAVTFLPLEAIWSDRRADYSRTVPKRDVASGYTRFHRGDVLCPKVTPTFQAGRSMIARGVGAGTTELHILRPRTGVDPRWISYCLRSKHFLAEGVAAFQGVAGLQRVPGEFVNGFRVANVKPDEQRRIADFLDDRISRIDKIIAARREQDRAAHSLLVGRMIAAIFKDGDTSVPARSMAEIRLGRQRSPRHEAGEYLVAYLRSANVRDGELLLDDVKRMNFTPSEQLTFSLSPGDVLMTEGSASPEAVGASAVWEANLPGVVCFQNTLVRLRARAGTDPRFLEFWCRASHAVGAHRAWSSGASILHLGSEGVSRMPFPRISIPEQISRARRAAEAQRAAENGQASLARSVNLLTEYKSSLITAAVTGELDVTTAGSNIPGG